MLPPVGWVQVHPEITSPSNFHHLRDTTNDTEITGYAISKRLRPELQDQPKVSGFNGPCWGGFSQFGEPIIRYEDDETYRQLSQ